jgi:hypothetical protein
MNHYQLASPARPPPDEAAGGRDDFYWLVRKVHTPTSNAHITIERGEAGIAFSYGRDLELQGRARRGEQLTREHFVKKLKL